jgi:hypothetical protein
MELKLTTLKFLIFDKKKHLLLDLWVRCLTSFNLASVCKVELKLTKKLNVKIEDEVECEGFLKFRDV